MVAVVIDTSVLKGAGWNSARMLSLFALAKDASIELYIPETAYHEVRTQWRHAYEENHGLLIKSLKALRAASLLPDSEKSILEALDLEIQKATNAEDLSQLTFKNLCTENSIQVRECSPEQMARAWASYFKGEPPFVNAKDRNDLPDAHIFETIKDLAKEKPGLFILCADNRLTKACETLPDVTVLGKIDHFLANPIVKNAEHQTKLTKHWDSVKDGLTAVMDEEIADYVIANIDTILIGRTVRDVSLPSDNQAADILMYGDVDSLTIDQKHEFSKGLLSCTVSFTSECLIGFYVFKSEIYDLPEWVSVSASDPEEHYVEAEGYTEVAVSLELTLKVNLREDYDDGDPIFGDIQISGKPHLYLA
ncbi:PIN domain-containing protein [Bosea sp. TAF32]|uniref:PIN domain-containing protein n=1 Tax=Bosea sp. TAF32 TaxID=3237482 RepID=UPI003F90F78A